MPRVTAALSLNQPDPQVLHILAGLKRLSLFIAISVATFSLAVSLVPPVGHLLPVAWGEMSTIAAACTLLGASSLFLSMPLRSQRALSTSYALAGLVILLSGYSALHSLFPSSTIHPDQAALQTAFAFLLLGTLLLGLRVRRVILSGCVDALLFLLCTLTLVVFFRYTLGSIHTMDVSNQTSIPGNAILCLCALTFVAFNHRAEYGIFSVLLGPGIAGKTARLAAPFALGLPVIRSVGRGYIHNEYVTAFSSLAAFCLILLICLRIHGLEREVRELSLRDELTGLYNRRGFNVLAEQAHRLARRAGEPFSVLFIDLDNLKQINDIQGHDAGSTLIQDMSDILRNSFRETDVIARLGGDEFVVAGRSSALEITNSSVRLHETAARVRPGTLSFSLGHTTSDHIVPQTLEEMIQRADKMMYETKRNKKNPSVPSDAPPAPLQIMAGGATAKRGRHLQASLLPPSTWRTPPCPAPSGPVKSKFPSSPSV